MIGQCPVPDRAGHRDERAAEFGQLVLPEDFSAGTIKAIATLEIVGALGLILPLLTGIAPILTPLAGTGLAIIMIGATVVHLRRKEPFAPALVLAVLAVASAVLGFIVVL